MNLTYLNNLNILQKWELYHRSEILKEIKQAGIELAIKNIPEIINETSFKIRSIKHPNKCPYYLKNISCHPEVKDLNCFLCACPNYKSQNLEGGCKINSRFGKWTYHQNLPKGRVWDCSYCPTNHSPKELEEYLKENIKKLKKLSEEI
jgi:Zn-finger protein